MSHSGGERPRYAADNQTGCNGVTDRPDRLQVFFDLDGTLTDPKQGIVACIRHALAALEIEIDESIDLCAYIGPPLRSALRELCPRASQVEPAVDLYRERFARIA